ncbi:MAG: LysM peptidoglycan-binding domain-containing protein [Cytophagales bacterium]
MRTKLLSTITLMLLIFGFAFSRPDSVGVVQRNGKTFIKHLVEKGETHFAISRRYGVNVNEIIEYNPDTKGGLVAGTMIVVPFKELTGKIHVVKAGETLFSLYRMYGVSVEQIKEWNNLTDNNLQLGQRIIVGKEETKSPETEKEKEEITGKIHEVKKGETLFSISRIYNVKWQDIKVYNGLETNNLSEGQKLGIPPSNIEVLKKEEIVANIDTIERPEKHIVKAGETMYSISKKYQLSSEDIIEWNDLLGPDIQIGQELALKVSEKNNLVASPKAKTDPIVAKEEEYMKGEPKVKITNIGGHEKVIERGMAELIEGGTDTNRFLGLHKSAPIGTIIQVKNEINGYSVFVRVVGKLPDIDLNKDIVLKITPRAFEALKGVDKKFKVEISWLP